LIFDLGGVVVDFDPEAAWFPYAQRAPDKEAAIRGLIADPDGPRARLSEGRISADEYFAEVERVLEVQLDRGEHRAIDVSILLGERSEMVVLLDALRAQVRLACFSNTHGLHWEHMLANYRCMELFEVRLASHLMWVRKPALRAFELACERLEAPPEDCIFIDDAIENVEAARQAGMVGLHFRGPGQLLQELEDLGITVAGGEDSPVERRRAVRALMMTPENEVLLMCAQEPASGRQVWYAPGGGREGDEEPEACLRRELAEETGRGDFEIGPAIWTREHTFDWAGRVMAQMETYHLIETERFDPVMEDNPSQVEAEAFQEFRWWTAQQVRDSDELFAPRRLAELLEDLIAGGPPAELIVTGV
jgi:epoxide hydrolase-like predicted phosphatase